jgi:hypothetical protein
MTEELEEKPRPTECDICGDEADPETIRECEQCSWNMGECCMRDDICCDCEGENEAREDE